MTPPCRREPGYLRLTRDMQAGGRDTHDWSNPGRPALCSAQQWGNPPTRPSAGWSSANVLASYECATRKKGRASCAPAQGP
jgi:hypothetical protein